MTPNLTTALHHDSVLLSESITALLTASKAHQQLDLANAVFVDATFGRGGHSTVLLSQLPSTARLVVFDKDPAAIATASELAQTDQRVTVVHDSFANMTAQLQALDLPKIDGLMADLGVSSPQLDDAKRGFSFMQDGSIDMRMNNQDGMNAGEWLARVDEETLANVLYNYGDERYSRRIAKAIKQMDEFTSTLALAETIKAAHPKWEKNKHPATKSFQAIRIFINNELGDIDSLLTQSIHLLKPNAALAIISFHSLEDRRVKQFLQNHSRGKHLGDDELPIPPVRPKYFYKPARIRPSEAEIKQNSRARSAWLRTAVRTDTAVAACD